MKIKEKLKLVSISVGAGVLGLFLLGMSIETSNLDGKKERSAVIAVVIDDFGNNCKGTEEIMALGIPITAAVMPFLPSSAKDAEAAYNKGHQVILHLPMEPERGKSSWLGPKGITVDLSTEEIEKRVEQALSELKFATGINNHTGSKAMKDERVVGAVLRVVKRNGISFLDSRTTEKSQAKRLCSDMKIRYFERDIFLDHVNSVYNIEKQLDKAGEMALSKGYAIVIGHVGPAGGKNTVQALKNKITSLEGMGIRFVTLENIEY